MTRGPKDDVVAAAEAAKHHGEALWLCDWMAAVETIDEPAIVLEDHIEAPIGLPVAGVKPSE